MVFQGIFLGESKLAIKNMFYRIFHYTMKMVIPLVGIPKPDVFDGDNAYIKLSERIVSDGVTKVLVVTDDLIMKLGLTKKLMKALEGQNVDSVVFSGVVPNPPIPIIEKALELYNVEKCNGIIAVGGGSSMDCAKIVGARASNPNKSILDMVGAFKLKKDLPPLYAIPTTSGTGSETTIAAVVTDPENHQKVIVADKKIVPRVAILDPSITEGLPPHITAGTGMDALTHAIEAYLALTHNKESDKYAEMAIPLIFENLVKAYSDGHNLTARQNMQLASFYAGVSFTQTGVGYVHAFAHNLGGIYGVPHGYTNAIVLPYIIEESLEKQIPRLAHLAILCKFGTQGEDQDKLARKFLDNVIKINENLKIPRVVKELKQTDIPLLVERIYEEANPGYAVPKFLSKQDVERVLRTLSPPSV